MINLRESSRQYSVLTDYELPRTIYENDMPVINELVNSGLMRVNTERALAYATDRGKEILGEIREHNLSTPRKYLKLFFNQISPLHGLLAVINKMVSSNKGSK